MYLKDGREIYECDRYPGYFIDANTGAFCDEQGNYIGGNIDDGDKPGRNRFQSVFSKTDYVYISKSGKLFYPKPTAAATTRVEHTVAIARGYKPSRGYQTMVERLWNNQGKTKRSRTFKSKKA